LYTPDDKYFKTRVRIRDDGPVWILFDGNQAPGAWSDDYEWDGPDDLKPRIGQPMELAFRCDSDGMAIIWNGYDTNKKVYKTHPDGKPARYNKVLSWRRMTSVMVTRMVVHRCKFEVEGLIFLYIHFMHRLLQILRMATSRC
jgi:hypothetical protein